MSFLRFGKRIKNRRFDYIPRYYDPDKEELEKRLQRYKQTDDQDVVKERIRGGFRRKYRVSDDYTRSTTRRSNMILFATLIALLLISFFFITEYLPKIIATFD